VAVPLLPLLEHGNLAGELYARVCSCEGKSKVRKEKKAQIKRFFTQYDLSSGIYMAYFIHFLHEINYE
jgi:hypothetical protein